MQSINVLSEIDFKCQRKHPIILFWWNISINWCMNYFSDTPNPETQLSKDGSGAGFKVGKVKLHFEVHGLAFSIISCCPQQARATLWLFSLDPSAPENQRRSRLNSQSVAGSCLLMASTDIIENAKPCTSKCNLTLPTLKPAPLPSLNNTRSTLWHIEPWWTLLYLHSQMQPTHSFN